jgi:tetratricopeptide (TPR) repeat protein
MGWSYHELGDYAQALDHFQEALAAREATGAPGPIRIARWCVGRALRSLGRVAEALEIQRAARRAGAR